MTAGDPSFCDRCVFTVPRLMNNRPADSQIVEPLHREPRDLELSWRQAAPANRRAIARSAHMPHIANSFVERHLRALLPLSRKGSIAHRRV